MFRILLMLGFFVLISEQLVAKDVTYKVNGKDYEGFFLKHKSDSPVVILIHDWDGLTGYEKERAAMLQKLGYSVFAADLFGKGVRPVEVKDKKQHTGELYKDREKMRKLLNGALAEARKLGLNGKKTVAAGYCFGGAAVLEWARSGALLQGFASFHGGLKTPDGQNYSKTKGQMMVFHGSADDHITFTDLATLGSELEKSGVNHELISYSGAPHAFTVFESKNYHKVSDQKSWKRFTGFLQEI